MNCMKCLLDIQHSPATCTKTHDRKNTSSDALGWACTKQLIDRSVELLKEANKESNKSIGLHIASDNDCNYSSHLESLEQQNNFEIRKLDDVGHALKGINTDWDAAKRMVQSVEQQNFAHAKTLYPKELEQWKEAVKLWEQQPKQVRGKKPKKPKMPKRSHVASKVLSDLSKAYARKYVGKNLVLNPDSFGTHHAMQVLNHMFAGKLQHHLKCPEWCQRKTNPKHLTTLPRGEYYDRFGNVHHKLAYDTIKPFFESRFSAENCKRLHGLPRTNGNESAHSMVSGRVNKHTRPPKGNIVKGIVGSVVYIKNHGIGVFWSEYLKKLGLEIGKSQYERLQSIQSRQLNRNNYHKKDAVKIRRAKRKTEFVNNMKRVNALRDKEIHKSDVNLESLRKRKATKEKRVARKRRKLSNKEPTASTQPGTSTPSRTTTASMPIIPPIPNMIPPLPNIPPPFPQTLSTNPTPTISINR